MGNREVMNTRINGCGMSSYMEHDYYRILPFHLYDGHGARLPLFNLLVTNCYPTSWVQTVSTQEYRPIASANVETYPTGVGHAMIIYPLELQVTPVSTEACKHRYYSLHVSSKKFPSSIS